MHVEAVFTDSLRSDKRALEAVFPSLLHNVSFVPSQSSLELLIMGGDWTYAVLDTPFQINSCLNLIMEELTCLSPTENLTMAMDMEWSVNCTSRIFGCVSLISIAHRKVVYLVHVRCPFY